MIDPSLSAALARVAQRANDVLYGYSAGFEPEAPEVARRAPSFLPDNRPLSISAPNDAYFAVRMKDRMLFTRDGQLRFEEGELRAADGAPVLGRPAGARGGEIGLLRVGAVDAALGRPHDVRVEPDGIVSYAQTTIDPTTGTRREERVALGRLLLARFPAGTRAVRVDERCVVPPPGVSVTIGTPNDGVFGALRTHVRELGKVDLEAALRRLQEAYVSFEALQAAYRTRADLEKGAADLLK